MTLMEFLYARIRDDYERERGSAADNTAREFGARLKANGQMLAAGGSSLIGGRLRSASEVMVQRYADHPDYDSAWRIDGSNQ